MHTEMEISRAKRNYEIFREIAGPTIAAIRRDQGVFAESDRRVRVFENFDVFLDRFPTEQSQHEYLQRILHFADMESFNRYCTYPAVAEFLRSIGYFQDSAD